MSTRFYYGQQDYIVQLNLLDDIASGSASTVAFDSFDARYLGSKTADPTLNNKGAALVAGAMYWNVTSQLLKVYNGSVWSAVGTGTAASVGLGNVDNKSSATIRSELTTGDISSAINLAGISMSGSFEKTLTTSFPSATGGNAVDIIFGNFAINGIIEIELCGSYSEANANGSIIKRFTIGCNPGGGGNVWNNVSVVKEAIGSTPGHFAIGEFSWDAANNRYYIPIAHLTSAGNPIFLKIRGVMDSACIVSMKTNTALSALYARSALPANVAVFPGNATYATNATRLYASDGGYVYGGAAPYYAALTYNAPASRWRLAVTPGTPAGIEVAYADYSGNAATATNVTWAGVTGRPTTLAGYGITDAVTAAGNVASATKLQTARLINGVAFDGTQDITISGGGGAASSVAWSGITSKPTTVVGYGITDSQGTQSGRDFANGTLVTTSIDYSVSNGAAWYAEIKGNSYGQTVPFNVQLQGYIYNDTIINSGGSSSGTNIPGIIAINMSGKLCFWWPRIAYWHGFTVFVSDVTSQGAAVNLVTSITNSGTPSGTKQVSIPIVQVWTANNLTNNTQLSNGAGYVTSGGYVEGANKVYITTDEASATASYLTMNRGGAAYSTQYNSGNLYYVPSTKTLWTQSFSTINNASGKTLSIAGVPNANASQASIAVTNGNLHIDSTSGSNSAIYLNYYGGTGGTNFGNGASVVVASVGPTGVVSGLQFNGSGAGLTGMAASLSVNYASYSGSLGTNYISGGGQKPNHANFGAGRIAGNMLIGGSNIGGASSQWLDTLWVSTYSGGDVKGSNVMLFGKSGDYIAFARQDYDAANWGTVREIYHSGNLPLSTTSSANSAVIRDPSGDIFGRYLNATDTGYAGAAIGVTGISVKSSSDNYIRTADAQSVRNYLGIGSLATSAAGGGVTPDATTTNGIYYCSVAGLPFAQTDGALYVQGHSSPWVGQIFQDYRSGQIAVRGKNSNVWQPWRTVIDSQSITTQTVYSATYSTSAVTAKNLTGAAAYTTGTDGWWRSEGVCGWFNATYGVGIFANQAGQVRTYNGSNFVSEGSVTATTSFIGSGSGLTGTAASLTAGSTNDLSSTCVGIDRYWTGVQYFQRNKGASSTVGANNTYGLEAFSTDGGSAGMSFHRGGYYAVNMGLDYDNVFRFGGWSAAANLMQIDMSGNLTMLNNITAYSDERLKTNWRKVDVGFVARWAEVKAGTYDRIDSGETQVGLSAQDVQAIIPDAVATQADGFLSLNYGGAAAVATVELAKEVMELRAELRKQAALIKLLMEKAGI